jgi:hypothetical protein
VVTFGDGVQDGPKAPPAHTFLRMWEYPAFVLCDQIRYTPSGEYDGEYACLSATCTTGFHGGPLGRETIAVRVGQEDVAAAAEGDVRAPA